jgi:ferrous iron transport protein A
MGRLMIETAPLPPAKTAAVLADFAPGNRVTITGTADGAPPATLRRLRDLGFTEGTTVEVVRRAPLRDPLLYRIHGYEICLRREQAAHLVVGVDDRAGSDE